MATDPYNRIMKAAKLGKGVRLSADDVWELAQDDAIETRAAVLHDGEAERPSHAALHSKEHHHE